MVIPVSDFLVLRDVAFNAPIGDDLLQRTSFELDNRAVLAIAGPNGAGKTNLLNLLCGAAELT